MKVENSIIKSNNEKLVFNGTHTIENQIILPDYYDNIGKILKCSIVLFSENLVSSGERTNLAGVATLNILFVGEDGKLYNYETDIKYDKLINIVCSDTETVILKQKISTIKYRAVGPKRIDIRANVDISLYSYVIADSEIISEIDDNYIFTKNEKIDYFMYSGCYNRDFSFEFTYTPNDLCESIGTIIRKSTVIEINEYKAIKDKALIKGTCNVDIIYLAESDNSVHKLSYPIPFSEVIDMFGLAEDDTIIITDVQCKNDIDYNNSQSKIESINNLLNVNIVLQSGKSQNLTYISDLYSTHSILDEHTEDIIVDNVTDELKCNTNISYETETIDCDTLNVLDAHIDDINISFDLTEGILTYIINCNLYILISKSNGNYEMISRNISEKKSIETEKGNKIAGTITKVLSETALQTNQNKIRFSADLFIKFTLQSNCKVKCLTNVEEKTEASESNRAKVIIYFAEKDESLWEIGKNNKISTDIIKEVNGLSGDAVKENSVIILSN